MPVSLELAQLLAAGAARDIVGDAINCSNVAVAVGVYPLAQTGGNRPAQVMVRPGGDIFLRLAANTLGNDKGTPPAAYIPAVAGPPAALLFAGVEYVFVLSPNVNTLSVISSVPTGTSLGLKWIIGD